MALTTARERRLSLELPRGLAGESLIQVLNDRFRAIEEALAIAPDVVLDEIGEIPGPGEGISEPPEAPADATIAEVDHGSTRFGLAMTWTPAAAPGGTSGYECQVRYFNDSGLSMPVSGWMYLTVPLGSETASATAGPWPRPAVPQWVLGRVRAFNGAGDVTAWVTTEEAAAISATEGAEPPPQPEADDITLSVAEYGRNDVTGENLARIEAEVENLDETVTFVSVFVAEAEEKPTNPSAYKDIGTNEPTDGAGGAVPTWWVARHAAQRSFWVIVTASTPSYHAVPAAGHIAAAKQILVNPVSVPDQVTDWAVTVLTGSPGGVPSGRLKYEFTRDPGDLEYFCINVDRIACDNTYTPLGGEDWRPVGSMVDPWEQEEWWTLPDTVQYWQFRAQSTARSGLRNTTASPMVNVSVPANSGVTGGEVTPPPQPEASDWSVSVAEYGRRDQTGENIARLAVTATVLDAAVAYVSVFIAEDAGGKPTNPTAYKVATAELKAASGSTVASHWVTRKDTAKTYWVILTASSERYQQFPNSAHVAIAKSVTVNAVSVPSQPTTFAVTVIPESRGGVPGGRLKFHLTKPADPEYFTTEIERIECDSFFFHLPGAVWNLVGSAVETVEAADWWARPSAAQYWQFRATAVSRAFDATGARIKNLLSRPTYNLTVGISPGLDINWATQASAQIVLGNLANYPAATRPVSVISGSLPGLPSSSYPVGALVFLSADGKMYRNVAGTWKRDVDPQDLVAGTLAAGVIYSGTIDANKINAGTINVGSGGMTFTGTGGIVIGGSGSVYVLTGEVNALNANFKSAGSGWEITSGLAPEIRPAGFWATSATINCYGYKIGGTTVIDSSRVLQNVTFSGGVISYLNSALGFAPVSHNHTSFNAGLSVSGGFIEAHASYGFRVGSDVGLGVGSSYSIEVSTPSGTKTLWFRGGMFFAVT